MGAIGELMGGGGSINGLFGQQAGQPSATPYEAMAPAYNGLGSILHLLPQLMHLFGAQGGQQGGQAGDGGPGTQGAWSAMRQFAGGQTPPPASLTPTDQGPGWGGRPVGLPSDTQDPGTRGMAPPTSAIPHNGFGLSPFYGMNQPLQFGSGMGPQFFTPGHQAFQAPATPQPGAQRGLGQGFGGMRQQMPGDNTGADGL